MDGLTAQWKRGVEVNNGPSSDFTGEMGNHSPEDIGQYGCGTVTSDTSGMGPGDSLDSATVVTEQDLSDWETAEPEVNEEVNEPRVRWINDVGYEEFRSKLITHFNYLWDKRRIVWPSRTGVGAPNQWWTTQS